MSGSRQRLAQPAGYHAFDQPRATVPKRIAERMGWEDGDQLLWEEDGDGAVRVSRLEDGA